MGQVIKLQPRLSGKSTLMLAQAIEAEQAGDPKRPRIIVAANTQNKIELKRQLQCMVGMRHTSIEVLTHTELTARNKILEEQEKRNV